MTLPTNDEWDAYRNGVRGHHARAIGQLMNLHHAVDAAFTQTRTKATHSPLERVVLGHWARAGMTSMGVLRLCEQSYGDLAMALNRVLGDVLTSLAWLLVKPADQASRAIRYERFAQVEADNEATSYELIGWAHDAASLRGKIDAEVVAEAREKLFPKVYLGWTQCENTGALDKVVSQFWRPDRWRTIETLLRLTRQWGNDNAHAGALLSLQRVYEAGDDRTIDLRGRADLIEGSLVIAASLYQEVAGIASQAMGITELDWIWPIRLGLADEPIRLCLRAHRSLPGATPGSERSLHGLRGTARAAGPQRSTSATFAWPASP